MFELIICGLLLIQVAMLVPIFLRCLRLNREERQRQRERAIIIPEDWFARRPSWPQERDDAKAV